MSLIDYVVMVEEFKPDHNNGRNYADNKETVDTYDLVAYWAGQLIHPICVRWYTGRSNSASVVYCTIWVHSSANHETLIESCSGSGSAGGYGYCKRSAAFADALESAGIRLNHSIGGTGMGRVRSAIEAIGRGLGYDEFIIVENCAASLMISAE